MATKVTFKWNADQLNGVNQAILQLLQKLGRNTEEQLAAAVLRKLAEKLAVKLLFPKETNSVSLRKEEALALKLACERVELQELGNYEAAVMLQFMNKI